MSFFQTCLFFYLFPIKTFLHLHLSSPAFHESKCTVLTLIKIPLRKSEYIKWTESVYPFHKDDMKSLVFWLLMLKALVMLWCEINIDRCSSSSFVFLSFFFFLSKATLTLTPICALFSSSSVGWKSVRSLCLLVLGMSQSSQSSKP